MLQALYLDISKVDRVLQMGCAWETGGGTRGTYTQSSGAGDVRAAQAPCGCAKHRRGQRRAWRGVHTHAREIEWSASVQTLAHTRSHEQFKYVPDG
jgi:hypothetical protein